MELCSVLIIGDSGFNVPRTIYFFLVQVIAKVTIRFGDHAMQVVNTGWISYAQDPTAIVEERAHVGMEPIALVGQEFEPQFTFISILP